MPKGYFSAAAMVLTSRAPSTAEIQACLQGFAVQGVRPNQSPGWMGGPETLVLAMPGPAGGHLLVDVLNTQWPDSMGDPQSDPNLFGAWSMGFMGPFTFPGGLGRALQQCYAWAEAPQVVPYHRAFVRVRATYTIGKGDDAPILPSNYQPRAELDQVTSVCRALLHLPGALCYFNPNGETLYSAATLHEVQQWNLQHGLPDLAVWTNVRMFDAGGGWTLMDSVGMEQMDLPDHEACFMQGRQQGSEVERFLRNATLYCLNNGPVIKNGDTMNGPGGVNWQAWDCSEALVQPPRRTLRWFPVDGTAAPANLRPR